MSEHPQRQPNARPADHRRKDGNLRSPYLGFGLAAILALLLAFIGLGYPNWRHSTQQGATDKAGDALQKTVDKLTEHTKTFDSQLQRATNDRQDLADRLNAMEHRMAATISQHQAQLKQASATMLRAAQTDAAGKLAAVQTRLARLESSGATADNRVVALQRELSQVQSQMTEQAGELRSVRRELQAERTNTDRHLAALRHGEASDRKNFDALTDKLARHRVDFEVSSNREQEIAPGITLTVTGTNTAYRQVNGYLWLMPDRRTIWLRKDSAQKPVIFYGNKDGEKRELVFTNVTTHSATGYLLLPNGHSTGEVANSHHQSE